MSETTTPDENDITAGEYVLGVLSDAERRDVEQRAASDADLAAAIDYWQRRFSDLLLILPEATAPERVKKRLWTELFEAPAIKEKPSWFGSLAMWQTLAASAMALTLVTLATFFLLPRETVEPRIDQPSLVATLAPPEAGVALTVRIDRDADIIDVVDAALEQFIETPDRVAQLWVIPADGTPRSIGLISATGPTQAPISDDVAAFLQVDSVLAVSIEPPGGSPEPTPTGPVVVVGPIKSL